MKKLTSFLLAVAFVNYTAAQTQIPNGGFENWTSGNPTGWGSSDVIITTIGQADPGGVEQETNAANVYAGASSLRVKSLMVNIPLAGGDIFIPGAASLGSISFDLASQEILVNGLAYTGRPDSIRFAYKYESGSGGADTGEVSVTLTKFVSGNQELVGSAFVLTTNSSTFKKVSAKIEYENSLTPDTLFIQITSSAIEDGLVGSTLWVDEMSFSGVGTSISEVDKNMSVKMYPNPASDKLYIRSNENLIYAELKIYSIDGRLIAAQTLLSNPAMVSIDNFSSGSYIAEIYGRNKSIIERQMITIQK